MSITIEYKGWEFEFDEMPSEQQLQERYEARQRKLEQKLEDQQKRSEIELVDRDEPIVASATQQRFWLMSKMTEGQAVNPVNGMMRLEGDVELAVLEAAFERVIDRHEALRTGFVQRDGRILQRIHDDVDFRLPSEDLRAEFGQMDEGDLDERILAFFEQPYELDTPPLFRAKILRLSDAERLLIFDIHHIIGDILAELTLVREVVEIYEARIEERAPELPELPVQYADFAAWQRDWIEQSDEAARQLDYWEDRLRGAEAVELPLDKSRPAEPTGEGDVERREFSSSLRNRLEALGREHDATLYQSLLAVYFLVLHRYTGQTDLSVGTPVAGRHHPKVQQLVGCFINTLVMRTEITGDLSFAQVLERVKQVTSEAYDHQRVPFERVRRRLQDQGMNDVEALIRAWFVLDPKESLEMEAGGVRLREQEPPIGTCPRDVSLHIVPHESGFTANFQYSTELFEASTVATMAEHFARLLERVVEQPEQSLSNLEMLAPDERRRVTREWARGPAREIPAGPIHRHIERRADRHPERIACRGRGEEWTYEELNRRANRLAHRLRDLGVEAETAIGVSAERSPELLAGLLGVMKAGGAYVALKPTLPEQRLAYMVEDAGVEVVVCDETGREAVPGGAGQTTVKLGQSLRGSDELENPAVDIDGDQLAYILYTSGTTGRPKGVEMRHRAVTNLVSSLERRGLFGDEEVVLWKTPYSFDVSVSEMYNTLAAGATLVVTDSGAEQDPDKLVAAIRRHEVTTLRMVPTALEMLVEAQGIEDCERLERVICAGEALTGAVARKFFEQVGPEAELYNLLGATETCVDTTFYRCRPEETREVMPVGKPLDNYRTYVLGDRLEAVRPGGQGEFYVGGVALARGYRGMARRTALSFVPEPYGDERGSRMYRTGDLAKWNENRDLEYAGRGDDQLQVRGIRVELGEIEALLESAPGVRQAVVRAIDEREGRAEELVGYVVVGDDEPAVGELRSHLAEQLEQAVIPSRYVVVEEMPRNAAGKIDRSELPEPDERMRREERVEPRTETEERIASIWRTHLELDEIGVHEDFFEIGGHSLLAVRIQGDLQEEFEVECPLSDLLSCSTIAELAEYIAKKDVERYSESDVEELLSEIEA